MSSNNEVKLSIIAIAIIYSIYMVEGVVSLVYGFRGENDDCQEGSRGGLNLSDVVKWFGFQTIIVANLGLVAVCSLNLVVMNVLIIIELVGKFIWMVWTIVVLATNENNDCVEEGKDIAITAIVFAAFTFCGTCLSRSGGGN